MSRSQAVGQPRDVERFKNGLVRVVGLTGGIGGGKSKVAALLKERGAVVIDADLMGHELLNVPGVRDRIVARFGASILAAASEEVGGDSTIDRKALGAIVFADPTARRDLEAIVHPGMRESFHAAIDRENHMVAGQKRLVVLDAAILLEAGWDDLCDLIVFVDAPREQRMRRVEEQRGWSPENFAARERAQWPCDQKRRRADLVITNDADVDSLRHQVERMVAILDDLPRPIDRVAN